MLLGDDLGLGGLVEGQAFVFVAPGFGAGQVFHQHVPHGAGGAEDDQALGAQVFGQEEAEEGAGALVPVGEAVGGGAVAGVRVGTGAPQ